MGVSVTRPRGGVFVVEYEESGDLAPEHQGALVAELRALDSELRPALAFVLPPSIRGVSIDVPAFWLEVTATLPLSGMAIVTSSRAVRVAASGFQVANRFRNLDLPVRSFATLPEALQWLEQLVPQTA
jgi:hypothetical protein